MLPPTPSITAQLQTTSTMMGLFKKSKPVASSLNPIVTYNITQNLSGKLVVTSTTPEAYSYSITLALKKAWRDTLEVAIHRSIHSTYEQQSDVVGHCLIQTSSGKFSKTTFDAYGKDVVLEKSTGAFTSIDKSTYTLAVPQLGAFTWEHDSASITSASKRLKLVDQDGANKGAVLARFGGATGIDQFGILEVYDAKVASDQDWCALCVLTAVCVFAREERSRERKEKKSGVIGAVGNWGGLLTIGIPMGG